MLVGSHDYHTAHTRNITLIKGSSHLKNKCITQMNKNQK